ncbi:MAG: branched-chain amino acid ABC transporter permease [Synechococcales cyanobacterium RU_4_20]|nr:branched-chain amino acid ABC transporter permease [Synechococcales cyanobacterium RU_4_20]NJR67933.1 branched-chain amino acid ABC transporter permease [Synechococcales cyanobacterium CRU_2_2]
MILQGIFDVLFNGLSIGSVLLIAALGLAIVFGLMGVINLAHGELMMLGAYTTFVVQNALKSLGEPLFGAYIFVALIAAFGVAAAVGLLLERQVIRYLYGRPLETLLATWGVSLILRQFVRSVSGSMALSIALFSLLFWGGQWLLQRRPDWEQLRGRALAILLPLSGAIATLTGVVLNSNKAIAKPWFSARNIDVTAPAWLRGGVSFGSFQFPTARLFIIVLTALCLLGTYWFLQKSAWGLRIRAVTQNRDMSACLGIPTDRVDALTFAIGSGLAGVAGCAVTLLGSVGPNLGTGYIVDAFMVVVVGGVGKLVGSVVAAIAIGTLTYLLGSGSVPLWMTQLQLSEALKPLFDFFTFFSTTSMAKVMVFVVIITFLQIKPAGLFPQKGRTVET